ncbi:DUF4489 domain-containing protein [Clostridium sp. JN-1]|uniref:DUF4489 domain-containing protein n=1 Tax=Clostridium sp. JN-1 TaxID=2483110 RepID=UPI000F0BB620|nr:DUF4489 domain-containing protein [Clostridium sp. JN-1]
MNNCKNSNCDNLNYNLSKECSNQCSCSPEVGGAVMKCGSGATGPLPILDLAGASIINPYSVASVTIDTRRLKCPSVLINFTGLINVPAGVIPSITFRLIKTCNGSSQSVGGSYTFSSAFELIHSESFSFQFCDCGDCCGCTTYTVEISNATLAQAGTTVSGTVSAIAVENDCC